ncbi:MAG: hemolysin family protein [Lactobacillales bacterium]|jgi:putative hemolysin|nr:hemolysin family protein [Lactobacillales bacterium]
MTPDSIELLKDLALLVVLTIVNAFFVAVEISVVSLNKNRLEQMAEEENHKGAQKLLKVVNAPNKFLSTIQVGITLINILVGATLTESIASIVAPHIGIPRPVATFLVLIILTYVTIVFAELYPKRIGLNLKEKFAIPTVGIITTLGAILTPFVWFLTASTNFLSRVTPMKFDDDDDRASRAEIQYIIENDNELDDEEIDMLQGVFSLDEKLAREIMVPRTDAFMIDIEDNLEENIKEILDENYSRIPVYEDDKDKIIGVIHTKQLLVEAYKWGFDSIDLHKILQEPLFVPETIFIDELMKQFQSTRNQLAILLDEYGGVSGLVTIEDIIEEIVGEIEDESDDVEKQYEQITPDVFIIPGTLPIEEFNEEFEDKLDNEIEMDDVDTMAGYVITKLGHIPDENEEIEIDNVKYITKTVESTRLTQIKVVFSEKTPEEDTEED